MDIVEKSGKFSKKFGGFTGMVILIYFFFCLVYVLGDNGAHSV